MKHRKHNPKTVHKPLSRYSHGVEAGPGARWLHISGQVGVDRKGKIARGFKSQCRRAYSNLAAVLKEAGMDMNDVVKITVFLTRSQDIAAYREVRDVAQGRARPASTLLVIDRLASPDLLVEIEATAAKG